MASSRSSDRALRWTVALAGLLATAGVQALGLTLSGNWILNLGASDVANGAGSDLPSVIESPPANTLLGIAGSEGRSWTLAVRRHGAELPAGVTLAIRRTGSGNCVSLTGGLDYLTLAAYDQVLMAGVGDCSGIGLQLRLQGLSVRQPPAAYTTSLIYTLQ